MKALIVDDDPILAEVVSFALHRDGFETTVAHDGQVALERWQAEAPDIVILDLNLPKLDGLTFAAESVAKMARLSSFSAYVMKTMTS
jgi:DNA-binding response OmpR family regulator